MPKWSGSITADYNWQVHDGWTADFGGSVNYIGDRRSGFTLACKLVSCVTTVPAYTTINLNAGITHGPVSFQAFVRNIGNSHGIVYLQALADPILTRLQNASVIAPRTFGGQITVAF